jgi:arylsulfatase A-like enzyme
MPFFGPRDDQHRIADVPVPENFEALPGPDARTRPRAKQREWAEHGFEGLPLRTEMDWRRLIKRYWGLVAMVDAQVGRMMETLEDLGLDENTVVVYTSDHGDMMGSHRLVAKTLMYEESVRVPMMFRLPGQAEGRRVTGPVSQIDVVPTLLDLCGVEQPGHLQGRSLRPWLEEREAMEDDIFIEWNGPNGMPGIIDREDEPLPDYLAEVGTREQLRAGRDDPARTVVTADGWKFVCSPLGEHQLYNLNEDPGETNNLATDPGQQTRMKELRRRIVAWQARTEDEVELPEVQ